MPANLDNCVFALAPASWGKGNAPASFNIGDIPIYPDGTYSPCVLTSCAEGYGLINNDGDCFFKGDGANDHMLCPDILELNSVSVFSLELWFWQDVLDQNGVFFRKHTDNQNFIRVTTFSSGSMFFNCQNGDNSFAYFDYSTVISAMSWHHLMMIFNGSGAANPDRLKVFVDGSQVSLIFSATIPTQSPNLVGQPTYFGGRPGTTPLNGRIAWTAIYSDADTSRPATNFAAGRDMELIGISVENNMRLMKDICCIRKRRGIV